MSDEPNPFKVRAQARRAAALAAVLRENWEWMRDAVPPGTSLVASAEAMPERGWEHYATKAGLTHPPSEETKAMTLGLLEMPESVGLLNQKEVAG